MVRVLRVLLLCGVLVSPVFGQATVVSSANVISNTDKDRETVTSVSFVVPAAVHPGDEVWFRLNVPLTPDYEDTRNRVVIRAYVLVEGAWVFACSGGWDGGHTIGKDGTVNPDPYVGTNADWLAGQTVRMEIEVMRPMRVGATIQLRRTQP